MVERGGRARLLFETAQKLRIVGVFRRQDLDSNFTAEPWVSRTVNLTHAAGPKRR